MKTSRRHFSSINLLGFFLFASLCCLPVLAASTAGSVQWEAVSKNELIKGKLYPQTGMVKIGRFQRWVLELHDLEGNPVYPAKISIGGGMPAHGHGLPTQPQVTEYLDKGRYLIEGTKFNMSGDWVMVFGVNAGQISDTLKFEFNLQY